MDINQIKPRAFVRATVRLSAPKSIETQQIETLERTARETTLTEICAQLGFAPRVTGGRGARIYVTHLAENFRSPGKLFVGGAGFQPDETPLRVLETLAYAFNDYASRETVRGRQLFDFRHPPGRPSTGTAMSAAEKMRRHRRKKADKPGLTVTSLAK